MDGHVRLQDDDLITRFTLIKWTEHSSLVISPHLSDIGLTAAEYTQKRLSFPYRATDFVFTGPDMMCRLIGTRELIQAFDVDENCDPVESALYGCTSTKKIYRPWYYLPDPHVFLDNSRKVAYYDNRVYYETSRTETISGDLIVDESWYTAHVTKHVGTTCINSMRLFECGPPKLESETTTFEPETEHQRMYRFFFGATHTK